MSARKDDTGKPPISLIPRSALLAEARVMAKGKVKYGAHNWRDGGMDWSRLIDAAMRHLLAFADGEDFDTGPEGSGELHLANARCCLAFLIEYYERDLGRDDRYKQPKSPAMAKAEDAPQAPPPQARDEPEVIYQIVARSNLTGHDYDVAGELWVIREFAEARLSRLAANWPTFQLRIKEVRNDDTEHQAAS